MENKAIPALLQETLLAKWVFMTYIYSQFIFSEEWDLKAKL